MLSQWLVADPTLTGETLMQSVNVKIDGAHVISSGTVSTVNNCFYKLKRYTKFIPEDRYTQQQRMRDISKFYIRCARGLPYNEYVLEFGNGAESTNGYFSKMAARAAEVHEVSLLQLCRKAATKCRYNIFSYSSVVLTSVLVLRNPTKKLPRRRNKKVHNPKH